MAHAKSTDPNVFILPDLGEGLEEAELIAWKVEEGQTVAEHDILAEMETDKALVEVPSPRDGTIATLHGGAGDIIKVSSEDGEVRISGASDARSIAFSSIEPVGRGADVRDQIARASLEHGFGTIAHDCVAVGTMTSRDDGEPVDLGAEASRAIQYYFAKPYRVLAESDE